ncbi:MAG: hypothetical protein Q8S00_08835 [Deltaproteobacteria bacterium]|nr:hypothetical protein [Deltaproteobacteria bacterium]MDZ4344637.1 hypothetical protein [Candidatus Binatia bacterium]
MRFCKSLFAIVLLAVVAVSQMDSIVDAASAPPPSMGFFVTSAKSKTGNLGGLAGRTAFAKTSRPPWGREKRPGAPT